MELMGHDRRETSNIVLSVSVHVTVHYTSIKLDYRCVSVRLRCILFTKCRMYLKLQVSEKCLYTLHQLFSFSIFVATIRFPFYKHHVNLPTYLLQSSFFVEYQTYYPRLKSWQTEELRPSRSPPTSTPYLCFHLLRTDLNSSLMSALGQFSPS